MPGLYIYISIHEKHKTGFSLSGGGTKCIPISRPEILMDEENVYLLIRSDERGNKITLASISLDGENWKLVDVSETGVGQWEPNYDVEKGKARQELHIFSKKVEQADGEVLSLIEPQPVQIIELKQIPF